MATSLVETRPAPLDDSYHFVVGPSQETDRSRPAVASPSGLDDMRRSPTKPARPDKTEDSPAPQHPIPFMQDAFAESLFEATFGGKIPKPKLRAGDAKTRRAELLDQEKADPPLAALWRYRPGQSNHELRRLMAQISFGVYLLLNGMANSQALVVSILQGHIDEVDEFLETTLEDMGLATKDLQDRIAHLKLPMDNMSVFETMLEDQKFRRQILDGNVKIDHIVGRTQMALQQTVQDLAEGVSSTREFSIYLAEQEDGQWRRDRPDVIDIYNAMKGNTDGWFNAFIDLQAQASTLNGLVVRLNGMVAEMDRTAAMVSQRVMAAAAAAREPTPPAASPRQTPRHTPHGSDASSVVQHESPVSKIPSAPPRLSLRLSSIVTMQSTGVSSFFDIPTGRGSLMVLRAHETVAETGLDMPLEEIDESDLDDDEDLGGAQLEDERAATPASEEAVAQVAEVAGAGEELLVPQSPPARNPRRLSERPPMLQQIVIDEPETAEPEEMSEEKEADKKDEPEPDLGLYVLQPRTYTPIPPSPLPSPRVFDRSPLPSPRVFDRSPLPSPRGFDRPPRLMDDRPVSRAPEPRKPRESTLSIVVSVAKEPRSATMSPISPRSPTFDQAQAQAQLRRQPSKARLVSIGARATTRKPVPPKAENMPREVEIPLPEMVPPVPKMELPVRTRDASPVSMMDEFPVPKMEPPPRRPEASPVLVLEDFSVPKMEPPPRRREPSPVLVLDDFPVARTEPPPRRREPSPVMVLEDFPVPKMEPPARRREPSPVSMLDNFPVVPAMSPPPLPRTAAPPIPAMSPPPLPTTQSPSPEPSPDPEVGLPRQRSSLRQRVSLKTTPPESIQVPPPHHRAPDFHRPLYAASPRKYPSQAPDSAYGSDLERVPVIPDFPLPSPRQPMLVPSPHSDLQFFRPVQASPHSPLQQRPHTSGNPSARHPPARNIPSAMGMSMLSTQESVGGSTLKKKRSAFGWLKKAFSLDEEERLAFEQRKREQSRNLYYDGRSGRYVDGRRIVPPGGPGGQGLRRPETQYQQGGY